MKVGDRISVVESIKVYHHPSHKGEAFDIQGLEGEIIAIITEWHGRPISPNYPYEVKLGDKFKVHLGSHEIKLAS
ncbi:Ferredoxin thioredoxin reductase variable alpha chain [Synechococcus sp. PCC 7502]|uniref:ferredoxin-thioredoxin reductase variable chain n=1 Tax=Synechococcus sp. PCC 7502 TaxID=1173263 RepID=UPI00029FD97E|nr:ferredoxin-thioredoxin reductase variable chain [Synechococcus sp. PCC 7502]AFY72457.1 Ferredoxin thioredoxin reductase variable alpha chain [Synechococcus sp. PCC 7502]